MNSPLLNAYKQGTKEYKIASENYEYGYRQGKADERAKCETCIHKVTKADIDAIENKARADERAKVLDELVRLVCEYYTLQERAGYCADTNNMIKQRVADFAEQLKEQK